MTNVASFDEFETDSQIDAHSRGLPRIVLEGKTDVWLFRDVWFTEYQAKFEFMPASRLVDGDGCTAVPLAVAKSWDDNIPAYGVLDRDVYFRRKRWDALYERDEEAFRAFERNDNLFVSEFWEIEAHLILPEMLGPWVTGCSRDPIQYGHVAHEAVPRSLEQCEILFAAAPFYAAAHFDEKKPTSGDFGTLALDEVKAICEREIEKLSHEAKDQAQAVADYVASVCEHAPQDPAARLSYYLKFIDTKRLLNRLRGALYLRPGEDNHNVLASLMQLGAREPDELAAFLRSLAERAGNA